MKQTVTLDEFKDAKFAMEQTIIACIKKEIDVFTIKTGEVPDSIAVDVCTNMTDGIVRVGVDTKLHL